MIRWKILCNVLLNIFDIPPIDQYTTAIALVFSAEVNFSRINRHDYALLLCIQRGAEQLDDISVVWCGLRRLIIRDVKRKIRPSVPILYTANTVRPIAMGDFCYMFGDLVSTVREFQY